MPATTLYAHEQIDRADVEHKWKDMANNLGNHGQKITIVKFKESQDAEEKKLGVKTYQYGFAIAGEEVVFQTHDDTSTRWHDSFYITAAESSKAKTALLQVKYHMFNTIETLRIAGTEKVMYPGKIYG